MPENPLAGEERSCPHAAAGVGFASPLKPIAATMRQCFTARQHLRRASEFANVRAKGSRVDCGAFIMQLLVLPEVGEDRLPVRRLGVIASRRVGPAVKRNRAKRIFREIFRLNQDSLPATGCDLVVVMRSSFDRHGFDELQNRYLNACHRALKRQQMARTQL